jgi:UDP-N-acetylglucosamine 2-epimerase
VIKIVNIVGARPQFIKYHPISEVIEGSGGLAKDVLVHTGQHYDYSMSKVFFDEFGIGEPDYHLGVGSGSHGKQTGQILQKVEEVLEKEKPDTVLVYGDTNSTIGGALAASKLHIPVVHVESGLRSYNKLMPEEINRILTDHVSTVLLCPSRTAVRNLENEGFSNVVNSGELIPLDYSWPGEKVDNNNPAIINTGDVMYDALIHAVKVAEERSRILEQLELSAGDYFLVTVHRAESTDSSERFKEIIDFISDVSGDRPTVLPMHPRTRKVYDEIGKAFADNVRIIEPLGYFDILTLLKNSALVMTDSGGMQKEACWLKVPCITLRDETEWTETVESGWNVLYREYKGSHSPQDESSTFYGDGKSSQRILNSLLNTIGEGGV